MSQVIADAVGADYWSYMAAVMAHGLESVEQSGRIEPADFPKGVILEAMAFLQLALQALREIRDDPVASGNAFVIAAAAVRGTVQPTPQKTEEVGEQLKKYAEFCELLSTSRECTPTERNTARDLKRFFLHLKRQGDEELSNHRHQTGCF